MRDEAKEVFYVIVVGGVAWLVGVFVSWLPMVLVLPTLIAYTTTHAPVYLLILGVVAELCSWSFPGLFIAVFFIPWSIKKIFKTIEIDFRVNFYLTVFLGILLQIALVVAYRVFIEWFEQGEAGFIRVALGHVPWFRSLIVLLGAVVFSATLSAFIFINKRW